MDSASSNTRKRPRENETESQKIKREKAAERQRRKRERDRANVQTQAPAEPQDVQGYAHPQAQVPQVVVSAAGMGMLYAPPDQHLHLQHAMAHQLVHAPTLPMPTNLNEYHQEQPLQAQAGPSTPTAHLTKDEQARREKVRMSARERQRKHRALVRDRKLREMGVDPNGAASDVSAAVDDALRYAATDYIPHDLQHSIPLMEPPFPGVAQGLGGQTFASTLLLSFSCAPLLKAHLLRTLNMTNEELASLEPVIADAWDRWNSQRSIQYAEAQRQAHAQAHAQAQAQLQQQPPPNMAPTFAVEAQSPIQQQQQPQHQPQPPPQPQQQQHQLQPQHQAPHSIQAPAQSPQQQHPTPSHPPMPTFAHTNGPDLSSLDFRNRFSHQLTRPMPSFSPSFGGDPTRANGTNSIPADSIDPHLTNGTSGKNS